MFGLLHCIVSLSLARSVLSKQVTYGKYYRANTARDFTDNSYFLYTPPKNLLSIFQPNKKHPVIFFAFGNGWSEGGAAFGAGPTKTVTPAIGKYIKNGLAYVSLGYRSVDTRYLYDGPLAMPKVEELIHVSPRGQLTLDTTGRTMADYKVRTSWAELITKCIYDAVQGLEHLINHADEFGIDIHRIFFFASSAGASLVNYLTWVYHTWHPNRFTPHGMVLDTPQFYLPVNCAVGDVWQTLVEHTLPGTKLNDVVLFKYTFCERFLANFKCPLFAMNKNNPLQAVQADEICNATWNNITMQRFCTNETYFNTLTLQQMFESQKWTTPDPGMEALWYAARAMAHQPPKPFYLYSASVCANCALFDHGPIYPLAYAEHAASAGINYTVHYNHFPGMTDTALGPPQEVLNMHIFGTNEKKNVTYRSSFPWRAYPKVREVHMGSLDEHLLFICYALGLKHCGPEAPETIWQ